MTASSIIGHIPRPTPEEEIGGGLVIPLRASLSLHRSGFVKGYVKACRDASPLNKNGLSAQQITDIEAERSRRWAEIATKAYGE